MLPENMSKDTSGIGKESVSQSDRPDRHGHRLTDAYRPVRARQRQIYGHSRTHQAGTDAEAWVQAVRQSKQTQTHMGTCIRPCKHTHTQTGMGANSQTEQTDTNTHGYVH